MNSIYVSFNLKSLSNALETNEAFDKDYQTVYKPLLKFLYTHPDFEFSFSFTGNQIQYYKKRKTELITISKQLIDRKQLEILGGGFYDPILPLLFTVDRNGQIDMLSAEIRQVLGKRPRGATLFTDCWDSSLVNTFSVCGLEYVLLESSIIPQAKRKYLPLIMSDMGKSIEIMPYYDSLLPEKDMEPKEFIEKIIKSVEKTEKKDINLHNDAARIVNINLSHELMTELNEIKWFDKLAAYFTDNPECRVKLSTTSNYRKISFAKVPAYIPAGINGGIARLINEPYSEVDNKINSFTVHDFMDTYPQSHALYNRIMFTGMLINQFKNDKMRKNSAREKLWKAQNGVGLLCTNKGVFSNSRYRQQAYKYLMEAEKILREDSKFTETVNVFDYNSDGLNEYVCRMQNYFAYITLISGAIQELEVLKNTGNYADNPSRIGKFDKCSDDYERGLFIDHLFSAEQFKNYINGEPTTTGIFSQIQYTEIKFSHNHHELLLGAEAVFAATKQRVSLKKKYIINSNGMNVQYILKNESEKPLHAIFVSESNLAHTNFTPEDISYYNLEVVEDDKVINIDTSKTSSEQKLDLKNVNIVRLSDVESGVSFAFEPNENCGYCYIPLLFNRPEFDEKHVCPSSMTFVSSQYWEVNLEPHMETEKNINFSIASIKKERRKKL